MKPNAQVLEHSGSLGGETIAMQIDAAATAHIMSVLTDLYSDPVLAVIREYSTNALDAHIMGKVKRPIEVSTPSQMTPSFSVRDYGIGLDREDIRKIYSQYGASTKRNSNAVNGILGLGCKSALTYTNQFTVTSIKDGIKTIVAVSRTADGAGQMEVVSEVPSTDPQGTTVTVPVARLGWNNEFASKAKNFFRFWKKGDVLLDGQDPTGLPDDAKEIASGIFMVPNFDEDYVVMGNVAYPCGESLYQSYRNNSFGIVAFVKMGAVNFTPSREKLFYSDLTKQEIARVKKDFQAGLAAMIRKDIEQAPTHQDAFKRHKVWKNSIGLQGITVKYKGEEIPHKFAPQTSTHPQGVKGRYGYMNNATVVITYDPSSYRYAVGTQQELADTTLERCIVVTEFEAGTQITPRHREKMKDWAVQNGHQLPHMFVITTDKSFGTPWVVVPSLTWEDLKNHRLPKQVNAAGVKVKRKAKYDTVNPVDGHIVESDNITSKVILYVSPTEDILNTRQYGRNIGQTSGSRKALTDLFPGVTLVILASNRWDKFKRDYPNAQHVTDYAKAHLSDAWNALSKDEQSWLGIDSSDRASVAKLDKDEIDDPDFKEFIRIAQLNETAAIKKYQHTREMAKKFHLQIPVAKHIVNPLSDLPLFSGPGWNDKVAVWKKHMTLYLNAVYADKP